MDKWISVKQRLPEDSTGEAQVYVWAHWESNGRSGETQARYNSTLGWNLAMSPGWGWNVTHWMPLPPPPEDV